MDTSKLRPDTRRLWEELRNDPLLKGFVLFGGTALTLRIGHRVSEDLDFAYTSGPRLPERQLAAFINKAGKQRFVLDQNPLALESFLNDGMELGHYQLDYIVDGSVKVTFVSPEPEPARCITANPTDGLRVATLDEIFATKALVCAERSKTRDWFDLYVLMTKSGYDMGDFYRVFKEGGIVQKFTIASKRLQSCTPQAADEGYEHLLEQAPTLEQMREFFNQQIDQLEQDQAAAAFTEKLHPPTM